MSLINDLETIRQLLPLVKKITIREAIEAGDEVIAAIGLNPWCINEGRADGTEPAISSWKYDGLLEALDRLLSELTWQPIDTAPRDGTPIWVIDVNADDAMPIVAHWAQHESWGDEPAWLVGEQWEPHHRISSVKSRAYSEILGVVANPTHWKLLPSSEELKSSLPQLRRCM